MTRIFPYKKSVSFLFLLVYLLVGSGIANAVLLCEEPEAFSHLEFILSGDCNVTSPAVSECKENNVSTPQTSLNLFTGADCRHTQLSLSHVPDRAKKLLADSVTPDLALAPLFASENSPVTAQEKSNLVAQLPPITGLAALRTVVLLI